MKNTTMKLLVFENASKVYNRISSTHNKSQKKNKNRSRSIYKYIYSQPIKKKCTINQLKLELGSAIRNKF